MSSHSTSFEPKSWLTIILTFGSEKKEKKEIPNQRVGESEKKRKKIIKVLQEKLDTQKKVEGLLLLSQGLGEDMESDEEEEEEESVEK